MPSDEVLKSIRCEIVSYIAVNYQNVLSFDAFARAGRLDVAIRDYPYLDIDRWQYAGIGVDLRDVDAVTFGAGITRRSSAVVPAGSPAAGNYRSFNFGPTLGLTSTYTRTQLYAIPQYAGIGPALSGRDSTFQIYADQREVDRAFFCYGQLPNHVLPWYGFPCPLGMVRADAQQPEVIGRDRPVVVAPAEAELPQGLIPILAEQDSRG